MSLLGQRLRKEREARGLALLQVELDTRIRGNLIQALEEGDLENLPPEPFLRGLIRIYANYLRIDPQEMLDLYAADTVPTPPPPKPSRHIKRPAPAPYSPPQRPTSTEWSKPNPPPPQPAPQPPPRQPVAQPPPPTPTPAPERQPPIPTERISKTNPVPASLPEPFKAIRRRLPLAPPSAKPPKPVLKVPKPTPPPTIPPEILPPPEFLPPKIAPIKPPAPVEATPPPALTPPPAKKETAPKEMETAAGALRGALASFRLPKPLQRVPVPALIVISVVVFAAIVAALVFAAGRVGPSVSSILALQSTATPTRIPRTATPTLEASVLPTLIPRIAATAAPFAPVPGAASPTPTVRPSPRSTGPASDMVLDIQATQPITVQVGVDGAMVFNGPMAAGSAKSWTAKQSLYFRVENFIGANVSFNDRKQVPMNFGERSIYERQWNVGANGKAVATTPKAPPAGIPVSSGPAPTTAPTPIPATPAASETAPASETPVPSNTPTQTPAAPTATKTPFS